MTSSIGDRSQIARSIGPNYPESNVIANKWKEKMPSIDSLQQMSLAAQLLESSNEPSYIDSFDESIPPDLLESVYSGWDRKNFPYGHLTQIGFEQLYLLGQVKNSLYEAFICFFKMRYISIAS